MRQVCKKNGLSETKAFQPVSTSGFSEILTSFKKDLLSPNSGRTYPMLRSNASTAAT